MYFVFERILNECEKYPGFYKIPLPGCVHAINRNGVVINFANGKLRKTYLNKNKKYRNVSLPIGNPRITRSLALHRIVALLFVEKPARHKDIPYSELQVNHKDGNKENNCADNLEWMTNAENMAHARENNLFDNEKAVLARNLDTDEVIEFKSISECARWLCMTPSRLSIHLNSVCAGIIERDGHVFKFKNKTGWPDRISYDKDTTTLHHVADVVAENVETGKKYLCKTLLHALSYVGLKRNMVMNHRSRMGAHVPYKGWVFYQFKPKGDENHFI